MSAQKILVITTNTSRYMSLRDRLQDCPFAPDSWDIAIEQAVAGAQEHLSKNSVDLVMLDVDDGSSSESRIATVVGLFSPVPVVTWMVEQDVVRSRLHVTQGAAAGIDDTMTASGLIFQTFEVIVDRARSRRRYAQQWQESTVTLEAIADGVICTNSRAEITFANSAARRLLNYPPAELVGLSVTTFMRLLDPRSREPIVHPVHQAIANMQTGRVSAGTALVRHDGSEIRIEDSCSPIIDPSGALQGIVMVFHDTTEAYEMQAQIDHLAGHDFLTGLPNRFNIRKHLDQTLAHAGTHHQQVPVLYLDLDKFKLVNDTLGPGVGDKLLVSVAERLRQCFRLVDLVGRQGGDEFVVIMAPGSKCEDAVLAGTRILETLRRPHHINGSEVRTGCSVGLALFPDHGNTVETLLHNADMALQSVKTSGRNGCRVFSHELHADLVERQEMEKGLRLALKKGGFSLFYQPKVRLADGRICGCEALLRWQHPEWGWVAPTRFIPCAETAGLIDLLGRWVLGQAIRQAEAWTSAGIAFGHIAINVSAEELRHPQFIEHLSSHVKCSGIDTKTLQLELTESVLMHDIDYASQALQAIKKLGLSVAIDDFGTGYSSLSYLNDLPIDVLKIDRSFVHGIHRANTRQQALLHGILSLARNLALDVVVEGIETMEEEHFLLQNGCEIGQGYYYSEPLEVGRFEALLRCGENGGNRMHQR